MILMRPKHLPSYNPVRYHTDYSSLWYNARRIACRGNDYEYRSTEQERISINLGQGFRRKIHLEVKPVSQTAVEEIGSDLTEKSLQL